MTTQHTTESTKEQTPSPEDDKGTISNPTVDEIQETEADQTGNPNAEAAKYRRKLRDTEDALTQAQTTVQNQDQRINALQRKLIDQHTGPLLHDAADFWKFADVELGDLLDDEGLPNFDKVNEALNAVLEGRDYLKNKRVPQPDFSQGAQGTPPPRPTVEGFLKERLG